MHWKQRVELFGEVKEQDGKIAIWHLLYSTIVHNGFNDDEEILRVTDLTRRTFRQLNKHRPNQRPHGNAKINRDFILRWNSDLSP